MCDYAKWLRESEFGLDIQGHSNNLSSWRTAQLLAIARFLEDEHTVDQLIQLSQRALEDQLSLDGRLIAEMARPNSWLYATFALRALVSCAQSLTALGYDLWSYVTKNGRSLHMAFDFLLPYLCGDKVWDYPTMEQEAGDRASEYALRLSQVAYKMLGDHRGALALNRLESENSAVDYRSLVLLDPRHESRRHLTFFQ